MNTQIYEEASEWVVRHRLEDLDARSRRRFDTWLRQSPLHVRAYLEMSSIWEGVPAVDPALNLSADELIARARADGNVVSLNEPASRQDVSSSASVRAHSRPRIIPGFSFSLAATLLVAVGVAGWLYLQRGVYSTDTGEQRTVTLVDGSVIELNARSRIKVHYTDRERAIDLLQGQALFRVAKNPDRPFVVESNGTRVRAVGTQFDVYRKRRGTVVTVVEGRVAVTNAHPPGSQSASPSRAQQAREMVPDASSHRTLEPDQGEVLLTAGEQLLVTQAASAVSTPSVPRPANIEAVTAWTQQRLVFDFAPLTEVAEEFNRYNRRRLIIEDSSLQGFHVSGSFSSTDPTLLLRFLRDQPGIAVNETATEIRISRRDTGVG